MDALQQHRERMAAFAIEGRKMDQEIGRMRVVTELFDWSRTAEVTRESLFAKLVELGFAPNQPITAGLAAPARQDSAA